MSEEKQKPWRDIEDIGTAILVSDQEVFLASIAISLKRIADVQACPLVELPLRHTGVAHVRPSQVASVSVHGLVPDACFVQMIGDTGETGYTVTLTIAETMERLGAVQAAIKGALP